MILATTSLLVEYLTRRTSWISRTWTSRIFKHFVTFTFCLNFENAITIWFSFPFVQRWQTSCFWIWQTAACIVIPIQSTNAIYTFFAFPFACLLVLNLIWITADTWLALSVYWTNNFWVFANAFSAVVITNRAFIRNFNTFTCIITKTQPSIKDFQFPQVSYVLQHDEIWTHYLLFLQ